MSRKGSRRRRSQGRAKFASHSTMLLEAPRAARLNAPPSAAGKAIALPRHSEPLVVPPPPDNALADSPGPLPRNRSLVDPNQPVLRRLRFWMLDLAERWVERNRPLPEQPTIGQLNRLRSDLASVQRRLDRMLG